MRRGLLGAGLSLSAVMMLCIVMAAPARAQVLEIPEYRRLIDEREVSIARYSERLAALESRGDSLEQVKRGTRPGSAEFESVSNRIYESSREITDIARQLRTLYEQVRDLKTSLFLAYNAGIGETQQQIDDLTRRGRTLETSRELRRLVAQLEEYVRARDQVTGEIEEAQDNLFLPQLTLLPTDGPQQLRVKEAIARDAMDRIDERIGVIVGQIEKALQRKRDLEEIRRLQEDIELWGDRQAAQGGSEIEAILQSQVGGGSGADLFEDADSRIRELQRRRVELLDQRTYYETRAGLFARRQREFYP